MPVQVSQSVLADFDAATVAEVSAHAHDPLREGLSDLPPGITGGVFKLTKCRFEKVGPDTTRKGPNDQSIAGQGQLVIGGVVMEPFEIIHPRTGQLIRVAGQQFRPIPTPVCDLKTRGGTKTRSEQAIRAMEELKHIADNEKLFPSTVTAQILEQTALALEKRGMPVEQGGQGKPIYCRFSTEASDDGSMVFQNVRKAVGLENYIEPSKRNLNGQMPHQQFTPGPTQTQSPQSQPAPDPLSAASTGPNVQQIAQLSDGDATLQEVRQAQLQLLEIWKASNRSEQSFRDAAKYVDVGLVLAGTHSIPAPPHPATGWSAVLGTTPAPSPAATGPKKDDTWKVRINYTDPLGDAQTMLVDGVITECNADGTYNLTDLKTRTKAFANVKRDDLVAV